MATPPAGTILLVDDEDSVRVTLRRQLTVHGHTVLEASDGAEALELIRVRRGNVDIVLSDVVMPEMNGTELAGAIHREFPGLPVILMSAYSPAGLTQIGPNNHTVPVLQKPFATGQLEELIRVALELPWRRRRENRALATL